MPIFTIEKEAIIRATEKLREVLGDNLVSVIAFGSRVRGDFTGDSDFDILIIVRKRDFEVIEKVVKVFYKEEERTNISFSPVIKPLDIFKKEEAYNSPFYRNIKKEGIVFYGRA
ncbi:MAG: nucleotidyltransferase domain-containing protein [Thermodesulfovibrionales bacterium]